MNRYVPKILAQGVRAIVVLLHQGGSQQPYDGPTRADRGPVEGEVADIIYHLDPDMDVVVAGHDHEFVNALLPNAGGRQVLVVEPFDSGAAFAQIDLQIDRKLGTVTS